MKMVAVIAWLLVPVAALAAGGPVAATLPEEAHWALSVRQQEMGEAVASQGMAGEFLCPGSLTKLWVSGAALGKGKPESLETVVFVTDGRVAKGEKTLYLQGRGNALLTTAGLRRVAAAVAETGLATVGDIVADTTFFLTEDWIRERSGSAYAMPGPLGLDLHTVRVTVLPGVPGQPPRVSIEPPNSAVRFAVAARTVAGESGTLRIEQLDDLSYKITDNLPVDAGVQGRRFPLQDPALYAAGILKTLMQEAGIKVEGRARQGQTPPDAGVVVTIPGLDTDEMLQAMNRHSLNVVSDNLLLALGANRFGPPGTRVKGVQAVEEFLESLDLPMDQVEIYDGSGLSERNRVTADFMTRYLVAAAKQPWSDRFRATLPRPGYEGTVQDIGFKDKRFRVKTGRLEDVYALAGYGVDAGGKEVAFCFIVNGPGVGVMPNMDAIGADVLRWIAGQTVH